MQSELSIQHLLTWQNRVWLYLFSFSTLFFARNYCVNVCPFIQGLSNEELLRNLFIIFIIHLIVRETLYLFFSKPNKQITLPRHAYYLSIISWLIAGIAAFLLHFFLYNHFPLGSHLKLLSSYWILGAALFAQLEYILFERTYKRIAHQRPAEYGEQLSRRITETFLVLTLAPAVTIILVLLRYLKEGVYSQSLIIEIGYVITLFIAVGVVNALYFSKILREDTSTILDAIAKAKGGEYNLNIDVKRADELGAISNALEVMAHDIGALNKEITDTQAEVVYTMGEIAETRSKETGNHVKRVAKYSEILALAYGLKPAEAALLRMASPMHDIGKVGIPDSVLNKPGKHTLEEWKVMQTHAMLGYEILKSSQRPVLQAAAIVAREHHEKWDGSGYPQGLSGEDIHIYGRITAVADVFDALGSERVYKKAWEDEEIFSLLKEESGKHFDPALIELFFQNLEEIKSVRDTFRDI